MPKLTRSYLKFEINYLSDKMSFGSTKQKKNHKKDTLCFYCAIFQYSQSVLHRMMLIGHTHSSQFTEWQNLDITTFKHGQYTPNVF